MLACILTCKNSQRLHQDTAAQLDVCQFVGALCESLIQCVNGVGAPAVIYPVSGFDELTASSAETSFCLYSSRKSISNTSHTKDC